MYDVSMSKSEVVKLTEEFIRIPSVTKDSNQAITDRYEEILKSYGFVSERYSYEDRFGTTKHNLIAKLGEGKGGIGFFVHSDTVPVSDDWQGFEPRIENGLLYGRGSCDMKGPTAAALLAIKDFKAKDLKKPIYFVAAADEEWGLRGAKQIAGSKNMLTEDSWPDMGIVTEPTGLIPVYAHKGAYQIKVTAHGKAAHSSTDLGKSANFMIAPFLAEMAEFREKLMTDKSYMNFEFTPPTNGFNLIINDYKTAHNVTAAKSTAALNFRTMPNSREKDIVDFIEERARAYGFEFKGGGLEPFYTDKNSEIIRLALAATGKKEAITVPYGTDALMYQPYLEQVVLGPGSIEQAHTVDEFIDIKELEESVGVYRKMVESYCLK